MANIVTTTIWLIRHAKAGQPTGVPEPDWPLSDEGERQAHTLATFLKSKTLDHLYASPYLRAQQTLAPISRATGHRPVILDDLRERRLATDPMKDFVSALRESFADDVLRLPGGETLAECRARIRGAIDHICAAHEGQTIAVCSHGAAIASLITDLESVDGFDLWQSLTNPHVMELTSRDGSYCWRNIGGEDAYA